jgi:propionyl-CoA synthetase
VPVTSDGLTPSQNFADNQVVGHTYIVYAPLLNGSTTILYEGKPVGTPNAGIFWRIVNEYKVKALFTAPTALRAIKRDDDEGRYVRTGGAELGRKGMRGLQAIFLAGERSEPTIVTFYQRPSSYELRLIFRVVGQVGCSRGDGN